MVPPQAAHVMMFYRAPLNTSEKQTSIVLRDIAANATYGWWVFASSREGIYAEFPPPHSTRRQVGA